MFVFKAACAEDAYCMVTSFEAGMLIPLGAMILMLLLTQASHHIYVRTWSFNAAYSPSDVWVLSFGAHATWFPAVCVAAAYFVCMVTGFWETQSFVPHVIEFHWPGAPEIFHNLWFWQYFFLVILTLPSFLTTRVPSFAPFCWCGFVLTMTAILCLAVYAIRVHFIDPMPISIEIPLAKWDFMLNYGSLSAFNIAFFAHPAVPDVAREMHRPTRTRILGSIWLANILCGAAVYLIPAIGYLTMAEVEDGENVFHYLDPDCPEVLIGKIAVILNSVCSNVIFQFFLARTIVAEIHPSGTSNRATLGLTGLIAGAFAIWVNFWEDLGIAIFYGVSLVSFSIVAFCLPPLYFLAQYRFESVKWATISVIVLVIGGGMMLISLVLTVQDVASLS
jgi:hypothetical protein